MDNNDSRPPREWTLYESATGVVAHTGPTIANDEDVPVIEKSAFNDLVKNKTAEFVLASRNNDDLRRQLAEARAENERLMNVEYWPERAKNAEQDRDLLRAENAMLIRKSQEWAVQIDQFKKLQEIREEK